MLILITILILLATTAGITLLRVLRPGFGYTWLFASAGALLAWISVFFWQLRLPMIIAPTMWQPQELFASSPALQADGSAWAMALALTTMCLAVVLTAPLRALPVNPLALAGVLTLTPIGLIAVTAHNPLTLLIAWSALDLAELAIVLRSFDTERQSERAVFSFTMRTIGTGLLMWASVYSLALGAPLTFDSVSPRVGVYLVLASALRLGVLPIHLPYAGAPVLRRGFGSVIRLVSAAASLTLLIHLPQDAIDPALMPWLYLLIGATALYASWRWFRAEDELPGRPYWVIGMGALAVMAALGGDQTGSVAFSIVLVALGSLVFLYSHAAFISRWAILFALLTALGLPFTLTASTWNFNSSIHGWLWPLPLIIQVLLLAGCARFVLRQKPTLPTEYTWQRMIYPIALGSLTLVNILLGVWGWDGAREFGTWWLALIIAALTALLIWLRARLKNLMEGQRPPSKGNRPIITLDQLSTSAWSLYHGLRRVSDLSVRTFEGEGGILWTLLLLALFIALIQGMR